MNKNIQTQENKTGDTMKEDKISVYRIPPVLGIIFAAIAVSGILCFINKLEFDQILCIGFITLGFLPILIFELVYERTRGMIADNVQTTYARITKGFLIASVIMLAISLLPEYFRPVLILPLIMAAYSNDTFAIISGMFFNILLAMTTGGSFNELLAYSFMVLIGGIFSKVLYKKEYRLYLGLIFLFVSVLFPNVFYYFSNETIELTNLIICLVNGFVIAIYVIAFYPTVKTYTKEEIAYNYEKILSDNYVQVHELAAYAPAEYRHARVVSHFAEKYATNLGLNANLAAAAGFYYRLGKWEGEPVVENGVNKATELCFPTELIQILWEYNGIFEVPSSPESALVHIIDALLIKLEALENEVGTSKWNKEVLIYQTLEEFSRSGMYDKSGLSINAFIKIREWLAKEDLLI